MVDILTTPRRKCNIYAAFIPWDRILTGLELVHAVYLFCNTNYFGTTFDGMPRYFHSSQINVCVEGIGVLGPRFIVSSRAKD